MANQKLRFMNARFVLPYYLFHTAVFGSTGCLDEDTEIYVIENGKTFKKKLKDIDYSFAVISFNFNKNKKEIKEAIKINSGIKDCYEIILENNKKIICTKEHILYDKDGEIEMNKLKVGDSLLYFDKISSTIGKCQLKIKYCKIKSIKYIGKRQTYDLKVEDNDNFLLANKILSHNSGKCLEENTKIYVCENDKKKKIKIKDLPSKFFVYSYNFDTNKIEIKEGKRLKLEEEDCYEIEFYHGRKTYKIIASKEHKFFNKKGEEIKVKDLKVGDDLLVINKNTKKCLNCKNFHLYRKYCSDSCKRQYEKKNKIGWYSCESRKKGQLTNKKNKTGFYNPESGRKGGKIGGKITIERCRKNKIGIFSIESRKKLHKILKDNNKAFYNKKNCSFGGKIGGIKAAIVNKKNRTSAFFDSTIQSNGGKSNYLKHINDKTGYFSDESHRKSQLTLASKQLSAFYNPIYRKVKDFKFNNLQFESYGEIEMAMNIYYQLKIRLIKKINFQKKVFIKRFDFFINNVFIEWHPVKTKNSYIDYYNKRRLVLDSNNYKNNKLLVLPEI